MTVPLEDRPRPSAEKPLNLPGIDRVFIGRVVRKFYGRVRANERLGPIFAGVIGDHWEPHLEKMTDFWCSVILKNGAYSGRPVPAHLRLKQVRPEDFAIWLAIFRQTVRDICEPQVADIFIERAERIASSLQLAMFYRLPGVAAGDDGT